MQPLTQQLRRFIVDNFLFGEDSDDFSVDDSFVERAIIDSTGILELVGFLEQQYAISIEDEELVPENLDSLSRLTRFVQTKLRVEAE